LEELSLFSGIAINKLKRMQEINARYSFSSNDELQDEFDDNDHIPSEIVDANAVNPETYLIEKEKKQIEQYALKLIDEICKFLDDNENAQNLILEESNKKIRNPFTEKEGRILILKLFYKKSYKDIGVEMGIKEGYCRTLYCRSLEKLKNLIDSLMR